MLLEDVLLRDRARVALGERGPLHQEYLRSCRRLLRWGGERDSGEDAMIIHGLREGRGTFEWTQNGRDQDFIIFYTVWGSKMDQTTCLRDRARVALGERSPLHQEHLRSGRRLLRWGDRWTRGRT